MPAAIAAAAATATTTSIKVSSITSTELSDKLQKQKQQEKQQQQQSKHKERKLLTAVTPNKLVHIQQQQQYQQQQHKHYYNLIACAIAKTAPTTTKTITAPTTTIARTALKVYSSRGSSSGSGSSSSRGILTLFLSLMLHNHVFQTVAAAVTTIALSPTLENFEILHQTQNNNNTSTNNKNAMLQYHQHLHNNHNLFAPLQLPLQPKANSNNNNNTFKSFSIIDRLTAETEMNQMPIFDFGMPRNITGRSGQTEAIIKCRVDALNDKSVSWIRKRDLHILTVGTVIYTSDKRFEVSGSKDTREWTLHVKAPQPRDSGIYECQVNTEPKMSMAFQLNVIEISPDARAIIIGPPDLYFKVGSAIILNCIVEQPSFNDIGPIHWYRGEDIITPFDAGNDDNTIDDSIAFRSGDSGAGADSSRAPVVSHFAADERTHELSNNILTQDFAIRIAMESQLGDTLKSRLRISNAQRMDTGNYTCQPTTASSASVMVHVINDENPAAMQKSNANALHSYKLPAAGASFVSTIVVTTVCCLVYHHLIVNVVAAAAVAAIVAVSVFSSASVANLSVSITDSQVCFSAFVVVAAAAAGAAVVVIVVSGCDVVLVVMFNILLSHVFLGNFFAKAISLLFATT